MKRIYAVIICALLVILPSVSVLASNIPDIADEEFCVIDSADVISQETENYLSALNYDLENKTGASIVIATVDFTGSLSIDEYAVQAFRKWGIGDESKDNGLLVVMSVGDEDYWALQGQGIEKDLTSGELSQMLYDYMEDDFAKGDYDAAAKSFYTAAYEWFGDFYNIALITDPYISDGGNTDDGWNEENNTDEGTGTDFMFKIIMWIVIIAIVIILISAFIGAAGEPAKKRPQKKVYRKGPHTSSYRRPSRTGYEIPKRTVIRMPFMGSSRSSSQRNTSSGRGMSSGRTSSSSTRSSSSRSSGRSGGFGGGSSRGGGAGRRK